MIRNSIFSPIYIASALVFSLCWMKFNTKLSWPEILKTYFARDVWQLKTLWPDLLFCLILVFGLRWITLPLEDFLFQTHLSFVNKILANKTGIHWNWKASPLVEGILATGTTMLWIDFASYGMHRWMHANRMLRKIHLVHHSAEKLTFLTTYRQHPLEPILLGAARSIAAAIGLAFFHWFFPARTPVIMIQGVGAGFFLYMLTVNLHHSHIPVRYPKFLRAILISPHVHHLHHATDVRYYGKNFGVVFSIWDQIFGTYHEEKLELNQLRFGLK